MTDADRGKLFIVDNSVSGWTGLRYLEEWTEIVESIRSKLTTPRRCRMEEVTLREARKRVERHITNTYLKRIDAPVDVRPVLKCWMELDEG